MERSFKAEVESLKLGNGQVFPRLAPMWHRMRCRTWPLTLADTAFGLASNSHGMIAAGIDAHIAYHVAARAGDVLTATASEISRSRKIAVYRVEIHRADATLIASFTGTVYVTTVANEPQAVKAR